MNEDFNLTTTEEIQNLIYTIREKQVMLDSDVARLYHTETKKINQAVKRNIERFPEDFCFSLNLNEFRNLKSQIVTSSLDGKNEYGGRRKLPIVFTEQGIAMLSGLLRNDVAVQVSINIMNAFVKMRHFLNENGKVFERMTSMEYKLLEHDKKFDMVFDKLQEKQIEKQRIFFDGQIYDAYNKSNIQNIDIQKFNKQYPTIKLTHTNAFHDRFIIIDKKELYHLGASIKDLGKKCFAINKIENEKIIKVMKNVI